jgi:glutathione peroxidase
VHNDSMDLLMCPVRTGDGQESTLGGLLAGRSALLVNVASGCGLTPQYEALQALHEQHQAAGFTVVGFPCNQFGGQEPGTQEEIAEFCSVGFGVTFPVVSKVEVNGPRADPLWRQLTSAADAEGRAGEVEWNFEKFVISADGSSVTRFRPLADPASDEVAAAVSAVTA